VRFVSGEVESHGHFRCEVRTERVALGHVVSIGHSSLLAAASVERDVHARPHAATLNVPDAELRRSGRHSGAPKRRGAPSLGPRRLMVLNGWRIGKHRRVVTQTRAIDAGTDGSSRPVVSARGHAPVLNRARPRFFNYLAPYPSTRSQAPSNYNGECQLPPTIIGSSLPSLITPDTSISGPPIVKIYAR
jgi:hypothetical protein